MICLKSLRKKEIKNNLVRTAVTKRKSSLWERHYTWKRESWVLLLGLPTTCAGQCNF